MNMDETRESGKSKILIVDDTRANIDILVDALKRDYKLGIAMSGAAALGYLRNNTPDLILLDIMMPEMDGFEVCQNIKSDSRIAEIPIIFITAVTDIEHKTRGFALGGMDYITKPFEVVEVLARVRTQLALKHAQEELANRHNILEAQVKKRTEELRTTQAEVLHHLGLAAEYRDGDTGTRIHRIAHYCRLLAQTSGLAPEECELVFQASPMHDIGKIGIPDHILLKPGRLDPEEWEIMKRHTVIGAQILSGQTSKLLRMAELIALSHHEKWDGTGYPHGLSGKNIPVVGRIAAVCNEFDSLTAHGAGRETRLDESGVVEEIQRASGTHFDPHIVESFLKVLPEIFSIKERFSAEEKTLKPRRPA